MINKIINELEKITKDVYRIDILMDHITNSYLEDKWIFTMKTYNNLKKEIENYQNPTLNATVNPNFIINDYETLTQMISEYKEDIYTLFKPNLFILIDGLNNEKLLELSNTQKEVKQKYSSFKIYEDYIVSCSHFVRNYLIILKKELEEINDELEKKYIPFDNIKKCIYTNEYNKDIYININQIFTKMNKYYKQNEELIKISKEIRFNTIMMIAGDVNV